MNTSGIVPTEFNVLVLIEDAPKKIGSIHVPDDVSDRKQAMETRAVLVDVSPLAFTYSDDWPEGAPEPQVGEEVVIAKGAGVLIDGDDGRKYRLLKDKDICGIRRNKLANLDAQISELNKEAVNG